MSEITIYYTVYSCPNCGIEHHREEGNFFGTSFKVGNPYDKCSRCGTIIFDPNVTRYADLHFLKKFFYHLGFWGYFDFRVIPYTFEKSWDEHYDLWFIIRLVVALFDTLFMIIGILIFFFPIHLLLIIVWLPFGFIFNNIYAVAQMTKKK
jgi:DNA-directed RNA polymerase subunit RPC12/RpoP